jgi:hypothetical protein
VTDQPTGQTITDLATRAAHNLIAEVLDGGYPEGKYDDRLSRDGVIVAQLGRLTDDQELEYRYDEATSADEEVALPDDHSDTDLEQWNQAYLGAVDEVLQAMKAAASQHLNQHQTQPSTGAWETLDRETRDYVLYLIEEDEDKHEPHPKRERALAALHDDVKAYVERLRARADTVNRD